MAEIENPLTGTVMQHLSDDHPRVKELREQYMQPEGDPNRVLGLSSVLERRRWEYCIVDHAFEEQAVFDTVFIHQIEPKHLKGRNGMFPGTGLYMAQGTEERYKQECPRGVLVSAGAIAQEKLLSHGILMGDIVSFMKLAPWRKPVIPEAKQYLIVLKVGAITGSEDLAERMKRREASYRVDKTDFGVYFHDAEGLKWKPQFETNSTEYG